MQCFQNVFAKNHLRQLVNYISYQTFPPGNSTSVVLGWGPGICNEYTKFYFQAVLENTVVAMSTLSIVKQTSV